MQWRKWRIMKVESSCQQYPTHCHTQVTIILPLPLPLITVKNNQSLPHLFPSPPPSSTEWVHTHIFHCYWWIINPYSVFFSSWLQMDSLNIHTLTQTHTGNVCNEKTFIHGWWDKQCLELTSARILRPDRGYYLDG